jgi:predicted metalloprotease with PDZ domain
VFQNTSLQDAAIKTALPTTAIDAKTYNRPGVYDGGWVASFCLDTMIQNNSHGQKGLDDLFRLMMERNGLTGKKFTPDDLMRNASEVAGAALSGWFAKNIFAREPLPVKQCLADAGFDANLEGWAGEAFISPAPDPSTPALAIRQRLLANQP